MKKTLSALFIFALLVMVIPGVGNAGIEPVPWQPEINKLHSIELNLAAIQKRLDNLDTSPSLPAGTENYLLATGNHLGVLDSRLADVLNVLPVANYAEPYDGQVEVFFALDGIQTSLVGTASNTGGIGGILDKIYSRMGIEPSPWRVLIDSINNRINVYLRFSPNPCDGAACLGQ